MGFSDFKIFDNLLKQIVNNRIKLNAKVSTNRKKQCNMMI